MEDAAVEYEVAPFYRDYNTAKTLSEGGHPRCAVRANLWGRYTACRIGLGKERMASFCRALGQLLLSRLGHGDRRERIADEEIEARLQEAFARSMLW